MSEREVAIIGAGMAGVTAAVALSARGARVHVFEKEKIACTHASGKNAAIFRHAEFSPLYVQMAKESRAALDELLDDWLLPTGAFYFSARPEALEKMATAMSQANVEFEHLSAPFDSTKDWEWEASIQHALYVPSDGVIDIHAVQSALLEKARQQGVRFYFDSQVQLAVNDERVSGVRLAGELLPFSDVVVAAGAWCDEVGDRFSLSLTPLQRHLAVLDAKQSRSLRAPVLWRVDEDETYLRTEGERLLVSACDEKARPPDHEVVEDGILPLLSEKMSRTFPRYEEAEVQRVWSCLRTFAEDREIVFGPDPRVQGLHWHGGLGGHGMTLSMSSALRFAAHFFGEAQAEEKAFSDEGLLPKRLIAGLVEDKR